MNENLPQAEQPKEYTILRNRYAAFQAKIAKLNLKAFKLSVPPVRVIELREEQVVIRRAPMEVEDELGRIQRIESAPIYAPAVVISIEGESPKLPGGWQFVATIEHALSGNILRKAGSDAPEAPAQYRTARPCCDHCNTIRNRKDTYLVRSEAGDWKQIGRDCVKDFLGHQDPEQLAFWATILDLAREAAEGDGDYDFDSCGGVRDNCVGLDTVMTLAAGAIRLFGWWSRQTAEVNMRASTRDSVFARMFPPRPCKKADLWETEAADIELAKAAKAWVLSELGSVPVEKRREFDHNMVIVAGSEVIEYRNVGIACYIVQAYRKHLGEVEARKRAPESNHVGTVAARLKGLSLTVTGVHSYESQYGVGEFIKFVDATGNRLTWKASGVQGLEVGKTYTVTGTVKSHGEFRGIKETYLSRCKVAE